VNRFHTLLAVLALAIAMVGWQVLKSPETSVSKSSPVQSSARSAAVATNGDRHAPFGSEQATDPSQTTTDNPERVASTTSTPLDPETDPDCRGPYFLDNPETGESDTAWDCSPLPPAPHPYESYSDAVLEGLAYGDAKAAEVLGLRHLRSEDPQREALGLMMIYRSAALSGKAEVFRSAISARYASISRNGVPDIHNLKQLYIFSLIGSAMGERWLQPQAIRMELSRADVPAADIGRLEAVSATLLREMARVQSEITGNRSIEEAIGNV